MLGTKNLGDILSERESIAHELHELLYEATEPWGVQVERVEVKNRTTLPPLDLILKVRRKNTAKLYGDALVYPQS